MRVFTETTYLRIRTFRDEAARRDAIARARAAAAQNGFRGRVQFAWRNAGHAGDLIAVRVWAR
ncbi:hypothetical protein [Terrabacter terrigena]|uniref:Uncharacterized protein n=1 Tax=Terrabacter terrigena TaxID=574718 RepID=A0ABW3MYY0_9MICO